MTAPFISQPHCCARLAGAALLALASCAVQAQTGSMTPQAQYQADVAFCKSGQSSQDQATCLQEAGAALETAKRHDLSNGQASYNHDRTERCEALPADQRKDCRMLMSGQGKTSTQGSVGGGGVLRETVITVPAAPATPEAPTTPGTSVTPVN